MDSFLQIVLCDISTRLEQKFALPLPFLFEISSHIEKFFSLHVIEHDDICSSLDGFLGFLPISYFDIKEKTEPTNSTSLLDCLANWAFPGNFQ